MPIDRWRVELRESERQTAVANARTWFEVGDWERALASVERAQATPDLPSDYAIESTLLKARILERLGRHDESLAHFRYLLDRYPSALATEEIPADALSTAGKDDPAAAAEPLDADVRKARYTREARWSGVGGEVQVRCGIDRRGRVKSIRVVGPAHPLLASFAIEAVTRARLTRPDASTSFPEVWDVKFRFEADPVPAASGTAPAGEGDA